MTLKRQADRQQSNEATESLIATITPRDELAVRRYLSEHRDLVPYVESATRLIREVFDNDAVGIIASVEDQEVAGTFLKLGIQTALPAREAIDRLHAFDEQWLPLAGERALDQLLVTLVRT